MQPNIAEPNVRVWLKVFRSMTVLCALLLWGLYRPVLLAYASEAADRVGTNIEEDTELAGGSLAQPNFRIRSNAGVPLNADVGWAADLNNAATIDAEVPFRIRFEVEETDAGSFEGRFKLQWRKGVGAWMNAQDYDPPNASATEAVGIIESDQYVDGEETSDLLGASSARFVAGTGEEDNSTAQYALSNEHTEIEWTIVIHTFYDNAAQNVGGDTFEFRVVHADGTAFQGPYNNPKITLNIPRGLIGGTYVENPNRIGPFADANGNLYAIIEPSETFNRFMVVKSADGGATWAEADGAHRPETNDLEGVDAVQVGDTLHISHLPNTQVVYHRFRMSAHPTDPDTWEITDERITSGIDQTDQATALAVRTDGTIVVFYRRSDPQEIVKYKIRTVEGAWSPEYDLDDTITPHDTTWVTVVKGANDKVHIFYQDRDAPAIYHRSLDRANVLSRRTTISTEIGTGIHEQMSIVPPLYWDEHGVEKIIVGFKGADDRIYTSILTDDGLPSTPALASDLPVDYGAGASRAPAASLAVDGATVYLHYADQDTGDIFRDRNSSGSGWGSDIEEIDSVTGHWLRSHVFTHGQVQGNGRVVGYIWDNGSAGYTGYIRYSEHQLNEIGSRINIGVMSGALITASDSLVIPLTLDIPPDRSVQRITVDVQYDSNIITASNGMPDPDRIFSTTNCSVDTPDPRNTVTASGSAATGVSGQIVLCRITFDPVQSGISPLNISIRDLVDPNGLPLPYTVTNGLIRVAAPPVARDDRAYTTIGTAVTIDVVANDFDPDDNLDPTTAAIDCAACASPTGGSLIDHDDGRFAYTPNPDFSGDDGFVYVVCDADALCDTAAVTVTVFAAPLNILEIQVEDGADDVEERADGSIYAGSSDLELVYDEGNQTVGLRFSNVGIPQGAKITDAYVQFKTDEPGSDPTVLTIQGQAADDAPGFTSSTSDISARVRTSAAVAWSPTPWLTVGEAEADQRTPNIAAIIQEIIERPLWNSGNSLVIIFAGEGRRTAEAFEGDSCGAPLLHMEYESDEVDSDSAGPGSSDEGAEVYYLPLVLKCQ